MENLKIHSKYDELVSPEKLIPHSENPNDHSEEQIQHLAFLMNHFGIRQSIIVSKRSNVIISGHGRRLAAILNKIEKYPVVYQDFKSAEEEYAFVVADNAIATQAELDEAKVREMIPKLGIEFDIMSLGLKDFEIETENAEFPEISPRDPDFQQRTFVLSNEQNDFLNEAMEKAEENEVWKDEINPNKNGNILIAALKRYVHG